MLQVKPNKMYVQLSSEIDEERFQQMSRNEQFEELHKPNGTVFFEIQSIIHGVKLCREFITQFNLLSSNWMGGLIVDENYNFLARVSYNGRVWDNTLENWKIAKEIEI